MYVEFLMMNGYGQFVWPAFIFFLASCFYLYVKTRSELKQQERTYFLEFREAQAKKIEFIKRKESTKEALSIN